MNDLTVRKRLLIAQADLYRHGIQLECQRVAVALTPTQDFAQRNQWWLAGASLAGNLLLPPKWRGLLGLLPIVSKLMGFLRL
jgi:hypothetical protein